jgi:hypothetical protein
MPSSPAESKIKKPAAPAAPSAAKAKTPTVSTTKAAKKPAATGDKTPVKVVDKKSAVAKPSMEPKKQTADNVELLSEEDIRKKEEMRKEAEEEMERLRKAAWQAQVDYDRKQEEKRRKKAEEESRRKKEEAFLTKALLECAFDGEEEEMDKLFIKAASIFIGKSAIDACDGHGNTLLSEAAAGGSASTVAKLISLGADPNTKGEFNRTPLWRAAFLGKSEVVLPLMEGGADPRLINDSGELPIHIAANPDIKSMLESWDISKTDKLVQEFVERREKRIAQESADRAKAVRSAESAVEVAQKAYDTCQNSLHHARGELEKRINEHDLCIEEKKSTEIISATLASIKEAEKVVDERKAASTAAFEALDTARFNAREKKLETDSQLLPGIPMDIKELDSVLLRDVGGKLAADGRWPLIVDVTGQTSVFLRYIDSNYVSSLLMEPEKVRRSLLGAIRYGKPLVVDLMDVNLWHQLSSMFDAILSGLFDHILSKRIMQEETFKLLIKDSDGDSYDISNFQSERIQKGFKVIFVTSAINPNPEVFDKLCAFRVLLKE